jgi:hypothetical protein
MQVYNCMPFLLVFVYNIWELNCNNKIIYYSSANRRIHKKIFYNQFPVNHSLFYNSSINVRNYIIYKTPCYYSTYAASNKPAKLPTNSLSPNWVTGFTDAEGCFTVSISKSRSTSIGWTVIPCFKITLHKKDSALLEMIKTFFNGVGNITKHGKDSISYRISSLKGLSLVIRHFDLFPLTTKKLADYILFKQIYVLMQNKEHLKIEGLEKIIAIKACLNLGLSNELKLAYQNVLTTLEKPLIEYPRKLDPYWIAGFASGDGCFFVRIGENKEYKTGLKVELKFIITQHVRDSELLQILIKNLGCGAYYQYLESNRSTGEFIVSNLSDLNQIIIPFFDQYRIEGEKAKDFERFKKVLNLVSNKAHLTSEGMDQIIKIKSLVNKGRKELI